MSHHSITFHKESLTAVVCERHEWVVMTDNFRLVVPKENSTVLSCCNNDLILTHMHQTSKQASSVAIFRVEGCSPVIQVLPLRLNPNPGWDVEHAARQIRCLLST